jgi:hypothetical protein
VHIPFAVTIAKQAQRRRIDRWSSAYSTVREFPQNNNQLILGSYVCGAKSPCCGAVGNPSPTSNPTGVEARGRNKTGRQSFAAT